MASRQYPLMTDQDLDLLEDRHRLLQDENYLRQLRSGKPMQQRDEKQQANQEDCWRGIDAFLDLQDSLSSVDRPDPSSEDRPIQHPSDSASTTQPNSDLHQTCLLLQQQQNAFHLVCDSLLQSQEEAKSNMTNVMNKLTSSFDTLHTRLDQDHRERQPSSVPPQQIHPHQLRVPREPVHVHVVPPPNDRPRHVRLQHEERPEVGRQRGDFQYEPADPEQIEEEAYPLAAEEEPQGWRSWRRDERQFERDEDEERRSRRPRSPKGIPKLDLYDGSKPWKDFFAQFERRRRVFDWSQAEALDRLALNLSGLATRFFEGLPELVKRDYAQATTALEKRFGRLMSISGYRMKFQNIAQTEKESLREFADRVRDEAQEAYPGMDPEFVETEMVRRFLLGCATKEAALTALSREFPTLDSALEFVLLYVENQRAVLKSRRPPSTLMVQQTEEAPRSSITDQQTGLDQLKEELVYMRETMQELVSKLSPPKLSDHYQQSPPQ